MQAAKRDTPVAAFGAAPNTSSIAMSAGEALDPHLMERQLTPITRLLEEQDFASAEEANAFLQQLMAQGSPLALEPKTALDQAQEMVYQALVRLAPADLLKEPLRAHKHTHK